MPLFLGLLDDALHRCENFRDQDTWFGVRRFSRQSNRGHKILIEVSLHLLLPLSLTHCMNMPMRNQTLISLMLLPCLSYQLGLAFLHIFCIKFHLGEQVSLGFSKSIDPWGTKSIAPLPNWLPSDLKVQVPGQCSQILLSLRISSADMKSISSP